MNKNIIVCLLCVGTNIAVYAQGPAVPQRKQLSDSIVDMEEIVVTANRHETLRLKAPTLVGVLDTKIFKSTHAICVADGLSFQPGLRVEDNCQNCGFTQACLNGLDGRYTQLLLDSRPVFSAVASLYGLEFIPSNMVERVEVIHGGGSALYGSSAIGGVVNIITKEPKNSGAEVSHSFQSIGGGNSFDNATALNASLVDKANRIGLSLFANLRHRDGYDSDGDGFSELPFMRTESVGARSFLRLSDRQRITLQYNHIYDYHRGGDHFSRPVYESAISEMSEHHINGGSAEYKFWSSDATRYLNVYTSMMTVSRNSYNGGTGGDDSEAARLLALKEYGRTHDLTWVSGAQLCQHLGRLLFMPAELTAGVEYQRENLKDEIPAYSLTTRQHVNIGSGLVQNEWKNDQWNLLLGARVDKHSMLRHAIVSPRVNLRYAPLSELVVRLSYADGFRAPQIYDEDLHVSLSNGERWKIYLADNLKEERSHSVNGSVDYSPHIGPWRTEFTAEGFFTRLNHSFADSYTDEVDENGFRKIVKYNTGGAHVYGLNLEVKAALRRLLDLEAGFTWQHSRYAEAERWSDAAPAEKRVFRTPDTYGYLNATLTPLARWSFSANGVYTGSMLVAHMAGSGTAGDVAVHTPSFCDCGLQVTYKQPFISATTLEFSVGIRNLFDAYQDDFDKGPQRDADYIYGPMYPRSCYISAKMSI
jgi:outer membrane receptor for ferrienterochelin and colicins